MNNPQTVVSIDPWPYKSRFPLNGCTHSSLPWLVSQAPNDLGPGRLGKSSDCIHLGKLYYIILMVIVHSYVKLPEGIKYPIWVDDHDSL